jgi:hypothetical protein
LGLNPALAHQSPNRALKAENESIAVVPHLKNAGHQQAKSAHTPSSPSAAPLGAALFFKNKARRDQRRSDFSLLEPRAGLSDPPGRAF